MNSQRVHAPFTFERKVSSRVFVAGSTRAPTMVRAWSLPSTESTVPETIRAAWIGGPMLAQVAQSSGASSRKRSFGHILSKTVRPR